MKINVDFLFSSLALAIVVHHAGAIGWLGLYQLPQGYKWTTKDCLRQPSLTVGQVNLCRNNKQLMAHVQNSAALAREECQVQMQDRRWDCASLDKAPNYGYDLTAGTKESAFVHALSAASLMLTVSRACLLGEIPGCFCKVSGLFVKANHTRHLKTTDFDSCPDFMKGEFHFVKKFLTSGTKSSMKYNSNVHVHTRVNMHNNRIGRNSVKSNQPIRCRCHGVTGSCTMKHCMKQLPMFQEIAHNLVQKYDHAVKLNPNQERTLWAGGKKKRLMAKKDGLVFTEKSPTYCIHDGKYGTRGTKGRECNPYSEGADGCMKMCCGRGAQAETIEILERCQCKYVWCCYVKCEQCKKTRTRFTCR